MHVSCLALYIIIFRLRITRALIRLHIRAVWSTPVLFTTHQNQISHDAACVLLNARAKRTVVSRFCLVSYFIIIPMEVLRSTRVGTANLWYMYDK